MYKSRNPCREPALWQVVTITAGLEPAPVDPTAPPWGVGFSPRRIIKCSLAAAIYHKKSDEVEQLLELASQRVLLKGFHEKHNSVSLQTVNMIKEALCSKKKKESKHHEGTGKAALLHHPMLVRRNSPLSVAQGHLNEMATPVTPQKFSHISDDTRDNMCHL